MEFAKQDTSYIEAICTEMIKELEDNANQTVQMYKENPTFPVDFFTLTLREVDTRIQTIRDVYKRLTDKEL